MRIYHFTLIFAVFAVLMLFTANLMISGQYEDSYEERIVDEAFDRAADAAAAILAEAGTDGITGVMDAAAETFYASLASSFAIAGIGTATENLRMYVPVIAVTDGDGIYIRYKAYENGPKGETLTERWSDRISAKECELERSLRAYCEAHNEVAARAGIKYTFSIPDSDDGLLLRGALGTGFYCIMQGYPLTGVDRNGRLKRFNRYSFAGAGIALKERYFINLSGSGYASEMYFHRENCRFRANESISYNTRQECAIAGAYECPICGGDGY